jgi:hypothetical protein
MRTILLILLITFFNSDCFSQSKILKPSGTFLFKNKECAGYTFNSENSLTFINEFGCTPFELRLKWIDESTFIAIEKDRTEDKLPPRVYVYKILISNNNKLVLQEFNTSWNPTAKDEKITLYKN